MGSTFFGLNTALSGLTAQQRALNTVTHNLTNASTEGYSRQRVDMQASPAFGVAGMPGQIGTGVDVQAYQRLRDAFIDVQYRTQTSTLGQWQARSDSLGTVNQVIGEPGDNGLAGLMQRFWASWQQLSLSPESASAREAVRAAGSALATGFHDLQAQLAGSQAQASSLITYQVGQINAFASQINQLNQSIAKVVTLGQQPNDLLDQRDLLVDQISKIAGITVTQPSATNGKISIAIGSQLLVDSTTDTTQTLAVSGTGAVTLGGNATTLADGSLRGLIDVRDTVIGGPTGYLATLDTLAGALANAVNAQHAAGYALDGTTGNAFFQGTTAATIGISAAVQGSLDKIAASDTAANVPGGSANAVALAQIAAAQQTIGASTSTLDGYYQAFVSQIGVDADQANRMSQVYGNVANATANRRDAVSGVNVDEELTDMVRFQKSYNAAARMVTTLDDMLDTIVNKMGLVGR